MPEMKGNLASIIKISGVILLLLVVGYLVSEVPKSTSIDFSTVRRNLGNTAERDQEPDMEQLNASETEPLEVIQARNNM